MKKSLALLFFLITSLLGSDSSRLYDLYQNGNFRQACDEGVSKLKKYQDNEKYISLYAFSCLQADEIDRLALPIIMLKKSKEARKNATYFSSILLQKNLLIEALENHQSLSNLNLPTTDFVLSKVFDLYSTGQYVTRNNIYVLTDPKNPRQTYRIYLRSGGKGPALILDEYYDTILTKHHLYR